MRPDRSIKRSRRALVAIAVATLAAAGLTAVGTGSQAAGPAAPTAPPPPRADQAAAEVLPSYDEWLTGQYDAANSYATIEHLVEEIGPRLNGTAQERMAAEYLGEVLPDDFEVEIQEWGPVSTKRVADIVSTGAPLPGNPKWQMGASDVGVYTGVEAPVTGDVVSVGTGQTETDYDNAAGKIAFATVATSGPAAANAVQLAADNGAIAVILSAPVPAQGKIQPRVPNLPVGTPSVPIPVLGGGSDHTGWIEQALAGSGLSLSIATSKYENPMGVNVIATRPATGPDAANAPIVMVGAHIDSVLGAPGGHDDASGNGVSTEIARVLGTVPTNKEIRIGGFGGEEAGLLGARAYVDTLTDAEKDRYVGQWQMDMVGTPYEPARLWALTPDGKTNYVVDQARDAAGRAGFEGFNNCKLGQSDHQAFYDVGIPAALFIWLDYEMPVAPETCETTPGFTQYQTEPEYHQPSDTMANVSQERLQVTLDVVGGAVTYNALNGLMVTVLDAEGAPVEGNAVTVNCDTGADDEDAADHEAGVTGANGITVTRAPAGECTVTSTYDGQTLTATRTMAGDEEITLQAEADPAASSIVVQNRQIARKGVVRLVIKTNPVVEQALVTGKVNIRRGGKVIGSAQVRAGKAAVKVTLPRKVRRLKVLISYGGNDLVAGSAKRVTLIRKR